MAVTASRLRAIVSAETAQAQTQMRQFGQTVSDTAASSKSSLSGLSNLIKGDLTGAFSLLGMGAAAGAITGMVKVGVAMNNQREIAANLSRELRAYAGSAGEAEAATRAMIAATEGGISKLDATAAASKMMAMGLADNSQEVGKLARMAVMLGDKTLDAQSRLESFNMMLANQSIERLDTFGISSGKARLKIDEMMQATAGLTREQAFVNVVMEMGAEKLAALEAEGVTATTSVDKLTSAWANLRTVAADKVHLTVVVEGVAEALDNLATVMSPEGGAEREYAAAFDNYRRAVEATADAQERLAGWYARINPLARANYQNKLEEAQATEAAALAAYQYATMMYQVAQGTYDAGDAERDYIAAMEAKYGTLAASSGALTAAQQAAKNETDLVAEALEKLRGKETLIDANAAAAAILAGRMTEAEIATLGLKGALDMLDGRATAAAGSEHLGLTERAAGYTLSGLKDPTPLPGSKAYNDKQAAQDRINQLRQEIEDKKRANEQVAKSAASSWKSSMTDALNDLTSDMKSRLAQGMQFSVGLSDLRPGGGQGPNAPGQNGAFEDIYRLQAFVQNGTWGDTAAKYGVDQAGAKDIIQKFQTGQWDASVMQMVDKTKLTEQIQQAQLGQAMMDAVAADLAKASGSDPKLIKAMLGMGGASDQGTAPKLDLGGQLVPSLASAIDAELLSKGKELTKRGAAAWDLLEEGMVAKARMSTRFTAMVESMVLNALTE